MAGHAQRRPICGGCTKPLRLCLCARLRAPPLDTAVGVTVLQHAQEAKHPLNSTRVARLGLRNLAVATVTDVNLHARFLLRPLEGERSDLGVGTTQMGNSGGLGQDSGNCANGLECGHDTGEGVGFGKSWSGNCDDLDRKVWNCGNGPECRDDGSARFDFGNTRIEISGDLSQESSDCANGVRCDHNSGGERLDFEKTWIEISGDFGQESGDCANGLECGHDGGERLDFGKSEKRNCTDLSGKVGNCGNGLKCGCFGVARLAFAPSQMKNCGDLDQEVGNNRNELQCRQPGGERLDFAPTQMETSSDSGQKIVDCGNELKCSNGCGVIRPLGGERSDFAPTSQMGISVGNVVKCGSGGGKVELDQIEVKYQVENSKLNDPRGTPRVTEDQVGGNLVHPLAAEVSDFQPTPVCISDDKCDSMHPSECEQGTEVETAAAENWTVRNMDRCKVVYSENELRIAIERTVKPKIRWLSRTPIGQAAISNGFVVKKVQTKKLNLTGEIWELEEFEITIPPQSALLFPCQRSISIDAVDFEVRHLVVLDGTWAKAQRMYHENPWLQLLPHLKLDTETVSLYSEVRHEPRAGCLSTIESIACAMKKLGEDAEGLDNLLDVFESMIADQRRCKDENFKHKSQT